MAMQSRSPWLEVLPARPPIGPLDGDTDADVVIVGAGIAGIATAHFLLHDTARSVLLLEADGVARGATGHNAGQVASYFERPLCQLAAAHGVPRTVAAQRDVESAWALLARMRAEAGVREPLHLLRGHTGLVAVDQVLTVLRDAALRQRFGLRPLRCLVSDKAPFLGDLPARFADLYDVVPPREVGELLESDDTRPCAVVSDDKGCTNPALLCEEVAAHLRRAFPARFRLVERTPVDAVRLRGDHAVVEAGGRRVRAARVVLCSNAFADFAIRDETGLPSPRLLRPPVRGLVGFMAAFLEEDRPSQVVHYLLPPGSGDGQPYLYVTRRPLVADGRVRTLTCIGGVERALAEGARYERAGPCPEAVVRRLHHLAAPIVDSLPRDPSDYAWVWHGLMAYTPHELRVVGADRRQPVLLWNLGCNGVGFLPSIHGGHRVARLLAGDRLAPSLFDPR